MRWLPKFFLPILVALVLLLSAARNANAQLPNPQPTQKSEAAATENHASSDPIATPINKGHSEETSDGRANYSYTYKYYSPPAQSPPVWFQVLTTIVLIIFTGGLVWVGRKQAQIYDAQKKLLRQQTILAHRPRIKVREVHLVGELAVDQPVEVCLSLINSGETQATIISSNFTVKIWDQASTPYKDLIDGFQLPEPYDGDIHYFESQISGAPILPAGIQTLPIRKQRHLMFQPHEREQFFEAKSHTVFAIGYVFYRNDAEQHHKTGFCYRYDYVSKRFRSVPDPDLTYEY